MYRSKQTFLSRIYSVMNKYLKKHSISLAIRNSHIKATMRYHFTPVRFAIRKDPN